LNQSRLRIRFGGTGPAAIDAQRTSMRNRKFRQTHRVEHQSHGDSIHIQPARQVCVPA
jgi:hypothetical protein